MRKQQSSEPLVFKVGYMQDQYWQWVHQAEPGQPRFFKSSTMELLSKTPWWVVPSIWIPVCMLAVGWASHVHSASANIITSWMLLGLVAWQILEYMIHRFVFHSNINTYWGITFHFLFHGCHHKFPFDKERLVFPPAPAAIVIFSILRFLRYLMPPGEAISLFAGMLLGYVVYDCYHYAMHHGVQLNLPFLSELRRRHCEHHFKQTNKGYGISSIFVDLMLGTEVQ